MKRQGKKVATDRSFVVALSRGLDVLRAFRPNDGLLGNQEIAARTNLPKPTVSRLTYTLTKLGYLTPVPRFEKYQLAPAAMALGYAALANLGVRHLSEPYREELMRETGGAVAIGGRDRLSMIYFGQSRGMTIGVQLDVGSRVPIATTAMGRAYLWALTEEERSELLQELKEHSPIQVKILVAQVESIPDEVKPGLSPIMAGAVETICQRLQAELEAGAG